MRFHVFVVLLVEITNVKQQFMEKLSFERVLTKCCDRIKRDEYNKNRWPTDRDGYLVCGRCYEKVSEEICTVFVKSVMYLLMNTVIVILNNFFFRKNQMSAVWIKLFK